VGLLLSGVVAWAVYVAGVRLQLRTFFKVTSILLVVFGAAILRYAVHEFEEVNWLPPIVESVWNTGQWVPTSSPLGSVLQALIGYTSRPSLMQLIAYFGYLAIFGWLVIRPSAPRPTSQPQPTAVPASQEPEPVAVLAGPALSQPEVNQANGER
jgi:high-affinity iron transporter